MIWSKQKLQDIFQKKHYFEKAGITEGITNKVNFKKAKILKAADRNNFPLKTYFRDGIGTRVLEFLIRQSCQDPK